MAADWSRLTSYLSQAEGDVVLSWAELDAIVGGIPRSAIDHYRQWWHGDRPNTRAWREAAYEPTQIRPGVSVQFQRHRSRTAPPAVPHVPVTDTTVPRPGTPLAASLAALDPARCLLIVPCSAHKRPGGDEATSHSHDGTDLGSARDRVLAASRVDQSRVLAAWGRYDGRLYRAAAPALEAVARDGRLLILSGGYGVLDGREPIGTYDRLMRPGDWPPGLLEQTLAGRASQAGFDVVAFAGTSTPYARLLRRVDWVLPAGRSAHLVTMRGMRGVSAVSTALGTALAAFVSGQGDYPGPTHVERLSR